MTEYLDLNGCVIKVSSGISDGKAWMTCRVKVGTRGTVSLHRVKSKFLPLRHTREEAQRDLDLYAGTYGWKKRCQQNSRDRFRCGHIKGFEGKG